jgi:UBX domain-containing protein 1
MVQNNKFRRAPITLLNVQPGQKVDLKVAHRMQESYTPAPKKPAAAFSGSGQRLGGPSSSSSSEADAPRLPGAYPGAADPSAATAAGGGASAGAGVSSLNVDLNLPVTSLQIRLADGTRYTVIVFHILL